MWEILFFHVGEIELEWKKAWQTNEYILASIQDFCKQYREEAIKILEKNEQ